MRYRVKGVGQRGGGDLRSAHGSPHRLPRKHSAMGMSDERVAGCEACDVARTGPRQAAAAAPPAPRAAAFDPCCTQREEVQMGTGRTVERERRREVSGDRGAASDEMG